MLKVQSSNIACYEYWYPNDSSKGRLVPDWDTLRDFSIHAKRDKDLDSMANFRQKLSRLTKGASSLVGRVFK